jgi:hypothetical protein
MNHKTHKYQILGQTGPDWSHGFLRKQLMRDSGDKRLHLHARSKTRRTVQVQVSIDPQCLIDRTLQCVQGEPLRKFLTRVLAEREIRDVLTHLGCKGEPYPIILVRRAAEMNRFWNVDSAQECEVLYVATVLCGVQVLIADQVEGSRCSHLHRLDDEAPLSCQLAASGDGLGQ